MSAVGLPCFHRRNLSIVSEGFEESAPGEMTPQSLQAIWESLDNGSLLTTKSLDLGSYGDPVLERLKETQALRGEAATPQKPSPSKLNPTHLLSPKVLHQAQELVIEEATQNTDVHKRHLAEQISSTMISDFVQCLGADFLEDLLSNAKREKTPQDSDAKLTDYIYAAFRNMYEHFTLEDLLNTPNPLKPQFTNETANTVSSKDLEWAEEAQYLVLRNALINSCHFYQKTPQDYGIEDVNSATPQQLAEIWKHLAKQESCNLINELLSCNRYLEEYAKKFQPLDGDEKEDMLTDLLYTTFIKSHGVDFTLEELANPPTYLAPIFAPSRLSVSWPSIENDQTQSLSNESLLQFYYP